MSLLDKLKREIDMDPMDFISRKIDVECGCSFMGYRGLRLDEDAFDDNVKMVFNLSEQDRRDEAYEANSQ